MIDLVIKGKKKDELCESYKYGTKLTQNLMPTQNDFLSQELFRLL